MNLPLMQLNERIPPHPSRITLGRCRRGGYRHIGSRADFAIQSARRSEVGAGLGQQDLTRGLVFEPRIEGAIQHADNINLVEATPSRRRAGLELSPGFYASYSSDTSWGRSTTP